MNVADPERALLALIADDLRRRCDALLSTAQTQAAELRRQAHAQARARVRTALGEARERSAQAIAAASAQRQTRLRLSQQRAASEFLAQASAQLPSALRARWMQPQARHTWIRYALQQAVLGLPAGAWRIDHAPGLSASEIADLAADIPSSVREWRLDPALDAGLRIVGNGNTVDASLSGLLADHEALAARLLTARSAT